MLRFVVGGVFVLAGIHKTLSPEQSLDVLAYTFSWSTGTLGSVLLACIVFVEMLIGSVFVFSQISRSVLLFTGILLLGYLLFLLKLTLDPDSPACGCLGSSIPSVRLEHIISLIRNITLLGCVSCLWIYEYEAGK